MDVTGDEAECWGFGSNYLLALTVAKVAVSTVPDSLERSIS
jgi:hypothetical protein